MNSHYNELKDLPQLRGSLNTLVSIKTNHSMRRPPSLSESCAWDAENIERLHYVQQQEAAAAETSEIKAPEHHEPVLHPDKETRIVNFLLKLFFHISLISVFESIFFFYYVSTLEDSGILNVVGGFIQSAIQSCISISPAERTWINTFLLYFINANQVEAAGTNALAVRQQSNAILMSRSWYYVGGCCGIFITCTGYAHCRQIHIQWKKIIFENMAMILLLATYEYMFFTTIIQPYTPITGDEIAARAIHQLNASCGLF